MPKLPRMLTLKEAAGVLNVSVDTVKRRIRAGKIPSHRLVDSGSSRRLVPEPAIISLCGTARWMR